MTLRTVLRLPVSPVGFDQWSRKFSIDKHDVYWYAIWCKCAPGDSPFVIASDTWKGLNEGFERHTLAYIPVSGVFVGQESATVIPPQG